MLTLAQAQALSQSKLTNQVIDEFRKDPLFDMMAFDNTVKPQGGKTLAYVYSRVKTQPTAAFRAINSEYTAQETDTEQFTVNLKVFGGSFEIDRVLQNDETQIVNHVQFQLQQKTKAAKALFCDTFINGDSGVDANAFDGLEKAVTGSSTEVTPAAAINLSTSANITTNANLLMDTLDAFLALLDGTPSALLMNRTLAAIMSGIARRSGYFSTSDVDAFGKPVTKYQGIPLLPVGDKPGTSNPIIPTTVGETLIYAIRIGQDGVHAVSPEGNSIINTYLPNMSEPGAVKKGEVEMVAAMALKATRAAGVLRKIKVA